MGRPGRPSGFSRGRGTSHRRQAKASESNARAAEDGTKNARIEACHVQEAAERLGIDAEGLRAEDRRILEVLIARGRPMGIDSIAATLRLDPLSVPLSVAK